MHVLIVDLNNFSRYPTMSVGYAAAILRKAGHDVAVLSPLAVGVTGYPRVTRPGRFGLVSEWVKYRSGTSSSPTVRSLRTQIARHFRPTSNKSRSRTTDAFRAALREPVDVVLISAYTMFRDTCAAICAIAADKKVPVVIGGPLFNHKSVVDRWLSIDGLTGVFGGEPEPHLAELVAQVGASGGDANIAGFSTRAHYRSALPPFADLDSIPFPDYTDFPWDKYPNRIVPVMTGRGCGWGVCTFCSDVVTSSGRTFRSRSLGNVLDELKVQSERYATKLFTFLDLKLNSDLGIWRGLAEEVQGVVPGAQWTASIHVHSKQDGGLSATELKRARKAGLLRLTTGLESGSPHVLRAMAKGNNSDVIEQTVRYAAEAGISVRLTLVAGFPGETAEDVRCTAEFLDRNQAYVDRVVVNRFALQLGTPAEAAVLRGDRRMAAIENPKLHLDMGAYQMTNRTYDAPRHKRAMLKLLMSAHNVNRKPLSHISTRFEGVM